jgi:hypothetical protein
MRLAPAAAAAVDPNVWLYTDCMATHLVTVTVQTAPDQNRTAAAAAGCPPLATYRMPTQAQASRQASRVHLQRIAYAIIVE